MARYAPIGMVFFVLFFIALCSMFLLNKSPQANQSASFSDGSAVQSDALNPAPRPQQNDLTHVNSGTGQSVNSVPNSPQSVNQ